MENYSNREKLADKSNSRVEMPEARIIEFEQRSKEFTQSEQQRENRLGKKEQRLRDLQDTSKRSNDCIVTEWEQG